MGAFLQTHDTQHINDSNKYDTWVILIGINNGAGVEIS
jgi:hypothetical protein